MNCHVSAVVINPASPGMYTHTDVELQCMYILHVHLYVPMHICTYVHMCFSVMYLFFLKLLKYLVVVIIKEQKYIISTCM